MSKVAVALSGGIDSAVVALLLLKKGYDVVGLTAKTTCTQDADIVVQNAKNVAEKLGIEHFVLDVSNEFSKKVINYFEDSYLKGLTPNPCIMCNKFIKWGVLFDYAINELGVDFIATGHYARIVCIDGVYKLFPAVDELKDQLYFLYLLSQEHLSKTLFPLSEFKKTEVKDLAEKFNLPPKSAKESQDICFIPHSMSTKNYLSKILKKQKGNFIQKSTGKVLGSHDGYWQFTVGQRKGIGIAAPEPLYVLNIDASTNSVYVGYKDELLCKELSLDNVIWSYQLTNFEFDAKVKIRYNMKAINAKVKLEKDSVKVLFEDPVSAIAPGQACVFYDINDGHLLGGGFI